MWHGLQPADRISQDSADSCGGPCVWTEVSEAPAVSGAAHAAGCRPGRAHMGPSAVISMHACMQQQQCYCLLPVPHASLPMCCSRLRVALAAMRCRCTAPACHAMRSWGLAPTGRKIKGPPLKDSTAAAAAAARTVSTAVLCCAAQEAPGDQHCARKRNTTTSTSVTSGRPGQARPGQARPGQARPGRQPAQDLAGCSVGPTQAATQQFHAGGCHSGMQVMQPSP